MMYAKVGIASITITMCTGYIGFKGRGKEVY